MILFSGFNQKCGQAMKINTRFNVNMIATSWYIKFTITKYFFASRICNMVCYVLYTTYDCGDHITSTAHVVAWLSIIQSQQTQIAEA